MSAGTISGERSGSGLVGQRARVSASIGTTAFALTLITLLAAALRFVGIGHQGFWFDEGNTALLVHFSPGQMISLIPRSESTPPLYYCVAWVWARVFGFGEAGLRSLSALCGVATVPVAFAAGRRLFSARVGLVTAALAACNPILIWYSQEARSYSLLVLLTAVSLLMLARALDDPTPRRLALWVVAAALALATHYYALLAVAPQALWLLWRHRRRRAAVLAVVAIGICGAALIPLALSQNGTGHANWIGRVALSRRLGQVLPQFLTGFQIPAHAVLVPLAEVLAGCGLVPAIWRAEDGQRRVALAVGALALGGLLLNLTLIAGGVDDLITRNVLALWLPAALLVAAGLGARRAGLAGIAATLALCGIGVTGAVAVAVHRDFQRPDWRGVARLLGTHPSPAGARRAILVQHYRDLLPLSLYLPHLRFMRFGGVAVRELDVVSFTSPPSAGFCWWGSACNLWPSRLQSTYAIPGFRRLGVGRFHRFSVMRLVADRPVTLTYRAVARALHTTRLRNDGLLVQR